MNTWRAHHPQWLHILWDNDKVFSRRWRNQDHVDALRRHELWNGLSDVIRYEILNEQGGFMPEADSECLRPVDDLFQDERFDAFAVYENEAVRPGLVSPLLASTAGNLFARKLVDGLKGRDVISRRPWETTGNAYMRDMIRALDYPRLVIWPSHYFNPVHSTGLTYTGDGPIFAVQKWYSTEEFRREQGREWIESIRKALIPFVDAESRVILVDEGTADGVLPSHNIVPFLEPGNGYDGTSSSGRRVIEEFRRCQAAGATHAVFLANTVWWVERSQELQDYFRLNASRVSATGTALIYEFRLPPIGRATRPLSGAR